MCLTGEKRFSERFDGWNQPNSPLGLAPGPLQCVPGNHIIDNLEHFMVYFDNSEEFPIRSKGILNSFKGAGFDPSSLVPARDCLQYLRVGQP